MPEVGSIVIRNYTVTVNIPKPDVSWCCVRLLRGFITFLEKTIRNPAIEISNGLAFFCVGIGIPLKTRSKDRIARAYGYQFIVYRRKVGINRPFEVTGEFPIAYRCFDATIRDGTHVRYRRSIIAQRMWDRYP